MLVSTGHRVHATRRANGASDIPSSASLEKVAVHSTKVLSANSPDVTACSRIVDVTLV